MKYIDSEKLIAEIERLISICEKQRTDAIEVECYDLADDASARMGELRVILETITSLQQEQPEGGCSEKPNNLLREQPKVDFDKEEFVGVAESPLKTFPRVNDFECGGSYRH